MAQFCKSLSLFLPITYTLEERIVQIHVCMQSNKYVAEYIWDSIAFERTGHSSHMLIITPKCECQYFLVITIFSSFGRI